MDVFTARYFKKGETYVGKTGERKRVFADLLWRDPEHYAVCQLAANEPLIEKLAHPGCPDCIRLIYTAPFDR